SRKPAALCFRHDRQTHVLGYLSGTLLSKNSETAQATVLADRVGYEVTLVRPLFDRLSLQQPVALWLHTHVREDALVLFGFESEKERGFFRMLIGVQGLGPKHALSLLAEHGAAGLARHIAGGNSAAIAQASGVGKKLA